MKRGRSALDCRPADLSKASATVELLLLDTWTGMSLVLCDGYSIELEQRRSSAASAGTSTNNGLKPLPISGKLCPSKGMMLAQHLGLTNPHMPCAVLPCVQVSCQDSVQEHAHCFHCSTAAG